MPTNHERLVWGLGDGRGLAAVETPLGRIGGLICWENLMPLARAALYESGLEVYLAPTADDSDKWIESIRHIARESRAFVLSCCVFQRASSYPEDVPILEGGDLLGRGGSAILGPDGEFLAGPLWTKRAFSSRSWIRRSCMRSGSASILQGTTRGRTSSGSTFSRSREGSRRPSRRPCG